MKWVPSRINFWSIRSTHTVNNAFMAAQLILDYPDYGRILIDFSVMVNGEEKAFCIFYGGYSHAPSSMHGSSYFISVFIDAPRKVDQAMQKSFDAFLSSLPENASDFGNSILEACNLLMMYEIHES